MSYERLSAVKAFQNGYHSEELPGAAHRVHNLRADAKAIAELANQSGNNSNLDLVHEALLHGVQASPFPDVERTLGDFAHSGDTICIWTVGDPEAQIVKVRNLGWEVSLRKPDDPGNFIVFASENKLPLIPRIVTFSQTARGNGKCFIVDDSVSNLFRAKDSLSKFKGVNVFYVFINRNNDVPPQQDVVTVGSLGEYKKLVDRERGDGSVTHILDLDGTLIDPIHTESSRQEAVVQTLTMGRRYAPVPRPRFRQFNGFYVIDGDEDFRKLTNGEIVSTDFFGHQAQIYRANGSLVKISAQETNHRPDHSEWKEMGGYRGAEKLARLMTEYRQKLSDCGLPVPQISRFLPTKGEDGRFFVVEVVPYLGQDLQSKFLEGTTEDKIQATEDILSASLSLLTARAIGADIKPANWVVTERGLVHIDPLPVIMVDSQAGQVYTEWPRIDAPEIQAFLYQTHMTPLALGFRFYQELCQIDPKNRELYQRVIRQTTALWEENGQLSRDDVLGIDMALEPQPSRILDQVLKQYTPSEEGFQRIRTLIEEASQKGNHPIYLLREMSFLLSSKMLNDKRDIRVQCTQALETIRQKLGVEKAFSIQRSLGDIPSDLWFLTIIRKLTHLSNDDWTAGKQEKVALTIIEQIARQAAYAC